METGSDTTSRSPAKSAAVGLLILALLILAFLAVPVPQISGTTGAGSVALSGTPEAAGGTGGYTTLYTPVFTDPSVKLTETSDPYFSSQLYREALQYEPLLGTTGTQVHMGYWSGAGNHGSLIRLVDSVNDMPLSAGETPRKAIFDEGVSSYYNYPSYFRMLAEHWYERANPLKNGSVLVFGKAYRDPYTVTMTQADDIWGQYSQRYADMAGLIRNATGKPVIVWCYVEGARENRVFYKYELPELKRLEQDGAVVVYFARTKDADWTRPGDWIRGTANAPEPAT
ncbi:MAG: hypothetical protein A4E35_01668 [Methanoregula sp. PtaU1.Bin051]|nr:MAG: hypothetical protein A4E35_01668 [Methanoregula sp. PtaU1.Bin051]